eukprot:scaffold110372_cov51-Phaeocystis_antarctica.AAC.2
MPSPLTSIASKTCWTRSVPISSPRKSSSCSRCSSTCTCRSDACDCSVCSVRPQRQLVCSRPGLSVLVQRGQLDSGCAWIIGSSNLRRLETSSFVPCCSEANREAVSATPPATTTSSALARFCLTCAMSRSMRSCCCRASGCRAGDCTSADSEQTCSPSIVDGRRSRTRRATRATRRGASLSKISQRLAGLGW